MPNAAPALMPLPLRVTPYADASDVLGVENINGFMHRLAVRNHHESPGPLFRALCPDGSFEFPCSNLPEDGLSRLATMSGIDVGTLEVLSPRATQREPFGSEPWTCYLGAAFSSLVNLKRRRVCPTCLGERAYDRGVWGLEYVDTCAVHGCELVGKCPACQRSLHFAGADTARCTCGFDLCLVPPTAAPDAHRAFAAFLAARLRGLAAGPERLAAVDTGQACDLACRVGQMLNSAELDEKLRGPSKRITSADRKRSTADITALGFALISKGDHDLLTKVAQVGRAAYDRRHPGRRRTAHGQLQPGLPIIEDTRMEALVREAATYVAGPKSRTG